MDSTTSCTSQDSHNLCSMKEEVKLYIYSVDVRMTISKNQKS